MNNIKPIGPNVVEGKIGGIRKPYNQKMNLDLSNRACLSGLCNKCVSCIQKQTLYEAKKKAMQENSELIFFNE